MTRLGSNWHEVGTKALHTRDEFPHSVPVGGLAPPPKGVDLERRSPSTSTCTCRSARTAAATATSSRCSAARGSTAPTSTRCSPSSSSSGTCSRRRSRPSSSAAARRPSRSPRSSRACSPRCRRRAEVTVEANPETVTPALAALLREHGVNRVSLGAQTLPAAPARGARAARDARRPSASAFHTLREAGFDNLSLDLIYGIPGQSAADLERDLAEALALGPEHLSCYELEAKPGTRFTHAHGEELAARRRRWRATSSSSSRRSPARATAGTRRRTSAGDDGRDLRAHHNLGYWRGRDYLGIGIGAVSTVDGLRWRNTPGLPRYLAALERGDGPPRELEPLDAARERASACCSASASTSRSRPPISPAPSTTPRSSASQRLGLVRRATDPDGSR